jgi:hypothetical protein
MRSKHLNIAVEEPQVRNPSRAAWGVLLISFAIFCALCVLSTVSTYAFFFQSTLPMTTVAQPSRGAIGVIGADLNRQLVDNPRQISLGNTVSPADPLSQGLVSFRDPHSDNMLIAMVTLFGDSSAATVRQSARPRFEWSNSGYRIDLIGARGTLDVVIASALRDIIVDVQTAQGGRVKLRNEGRYTLEITDNTLRVTNHRGEAVLIPGQQEVGYAVAAGTSSALESGQNQPRAVALPVNLIENASFDQVLQNEGSDPLPLNWACRPGVLNAPSSRFFGARQDGRAIIDFVRGDGATTNGETTCLQGRPSGEAWRDLTAYDYLALRATFYIAHQSLSACGFRGSECPLMLRVEYLTESGDSGELVSRELIYGFYAYFDPQSPWPKQCDTCSQPHILVKMQSWYTFQTENILAILPEDEHPVAITSLRFYASGHEYDVRVAEVSLLAQQSTLSVTDAPSS